MEAGGSRSPTTELDLFSTLNHGGLELAFQGVAMAETQNDTVSDRRSFIRSAWAVPVVATFALGATAMPASAKPVTGNSSGGFCTFLDAESSGNPASGVIRRVFGCSTPP
jgi:hypothetical protein